MTSQVRVIPKLILLVALAALARPVYATISYAACSAGCGANTSGNYSVWQTASGSAGLSFSMSPATFAGGNLVSGVYSDPTGTVLTGYNGAPANLILNGTALLQSVGGGGSGIEIALPANTYAVAFNLTSATGSPFTYLGAELGDHNVSATNYNIILPSGGGSVQFFGIISTAPITEIFVGPASGGGPFQINDFELGEVAPTPEASSAVFIGGGLVLLGILRRRCIHKPDGAVA